MSCTFFIADLHLCAQRPVVSNFFQEFLDDVFSTQGETLYILGDLFEYWIGDDGAEKLGYSKQLEILTNLVDKGKKVYFMHGNRDFLVGTQFSANTGIKILDDPTQIELADSICLLKHGDDLCTDDIEHQNFRHMTRNPDWQHSVLSKSIDERLALASQLRQMSGSSYKPSEIMDVNEQAIEQLFMDTDVDNLIHGHTHRPAKHDYLINNRPRRRIVLGDWHNGISYLKADSKGFELVSPT